MIINKKGHEVATPTEVAAEELSVELPVLGNLYTGNIMYIKHDVKNNPDKVYVQIMLRFCNFDEVEQVPFQVFANKNTFEAKVGDLVTVKARRLTSAIDSHGNPIVLPDGQLLLKASGLIDGNVNIVRASVESIEVKTVSQMQSVGLKKKLAEFSPAMARFLGMTVEP